MDADVLKGLAELVGHGLVDVGDDGPQLLSRFFQIAALFLVKLLLIKGGLIVVFGGRIDGAQGGNLPF